MNTFAAYVLARFWRSVLLSAVLGLLALLLPPVVFVAAAFNALVTLRRGAGSGLAVSVGGATLLAALVLALGGDVIVALGLLLLYLPLWCLALVLRYTRALHLAVEVALGLGAVAVGLTHVILGDPPHFWETVLVQFAQLDTPSARLLAELPTEAHQMLARALTGAMAAFWSGSVLLSLMLARAWQAHLYNPGGFRAEFYALRLTAALRWILLGVLAGLLWPAGQVLSANLLLVLMVGYWVQGLAVIHALLPMHPQRGLILGVIYVLMLLLPQGLWLLASIGYFDSWLNWRARLRGPA